MGKGACRYTVNRAESGVGDSVPFFVRIGEKVRATFYARIYEALLCPAEYPFASSTRSKRTHIANAGSAGLSAPVKSLVFAAMRCRDGLATLSALKSRSLSIRHKGALGVRGLLRDASIYRPSNRREAEREAANRFAGIRPHAAQRSVSRRCERCHVGQSPALPSPRLDQHLLVQAPLPVDMPAESSEIACRAAAHPRIGRPGAGKAACLAFRLPPSRLADAQCNVPCPGRRGPSIYRESRNAPSSLLRTPYVCRM